MDTIATLFALLCHQMPERSPQWHGHVFPLCWRCSGLYLGVLASYLWIALSGGLRRRMPDIPCLIGASILMTPFLVDGWASTLGLWDSPGGLRALTGLGYGVVLPLLLVPLASAQPFNPAAKPTLSHAAALLLPLGAGAMMLLVLHEPPATGAYDVLSGLALLGLVIFVVNFAFTVRVRHNAQRWLAH